MTNVIIYTTDYCPYCHAAKAFFNDKGVPFKEINVEGDDQKREWLVEQTGQHTVPQIFINDKPCGGFTDVQALDQEGKLDALLEEAETSSS